LEDIFLDTDFSHFGFVLLFIDKMNVYFVWSVTRMKIVPKKLKDDIKNVETLKKAKICCLKGKKCENVIFGQIFFKICDMLLTFFP